MKPIQVIGKHRLQNGDVYLGIDRLMNGEKADFCYSDPPWGSGNLKYWKTMNEKMNETAIKPECLDVEDFLDKIFQIAKKHTKGFVVIEYGLKWQDKVMYFARKNGLHFCTKVQTLYGSGSQKLPLINMFFHTEGVQEIDVSSIHNLTGYEVVFRIFSLLNAKQNVTKVLDFCCGMGYTAQASIDNDLQFFGNELNTARLEKTVKRLVDNKKSKYAK